MKPCVYVASDYAGMKTPLVQFYYGYERTTCPEHGDDSRECLEADCEKCERCFVATLPRGEIRIPFSKLRVEEGSKWDCGAALMMGIAWVLTKYSLTTTESEGDDE